MRISTIAAVANNNVIGKDNDLVWTLPADMRFFMETTAGHVVITGRRNYESIPNKYRPLKGRTNVVITRNRDYKAEGAIVVHDLRDALDKAHALGETECFIIGGGQIYKQALLGNMVDTQYITHASRSGGRRLLPGTCMERLGGRGWPAKRPMTSMTMPSSSSGTIDNGHERHCLWVAHITDWQGTTTCHLPALVARLDLRHVGKAALLATAFTLSQLHPCHRVIGCLRVSGKWVEFLIPVTILGTACGGVPEIEGRKVMSLAIGFSFMGWVRSFSNDQTTCGSWRVFSSSGLRLGNCSSWPSCWQSRVYFVHATFPRAISSSSSAEELLFCLL